MQEGGGRGKLFLLGRRKKKKTSNHIGMIQSFKSY